MNVATELVRAQREYAELRSLPHKYWVGFYPWQWEFLHSTNRMMLLTAANQVGKSTINIIKAITWATSTNLWQMLWPSKIKEPGDIPGQFWYLYPDLKLATVEFKQKWVAELMPRDLDADKWHRACKQIAQGKTTSVRQDPLPDGSEDPFGWTVVFNKKEIQEVRFNSGVTIYFKTYMQNPASLQAGTVYAIFCDEEIPYGLYPEVKARTNAVRGYFHLVFTATLGQEEWRLAMQPEEGEVENFPEAWKKQVSLYDCMHYVDGRASTWTKDRIIEIINDCGSQTEIDRRVHGKFVSELSRKYPFFEYGKNTMAARTIPKDWLISNGVDIGSGGEHGHPAAIAYVAISPEFDEAEVFAGSRMDKNEFPLGTTAGDVLEHHIKLKQPFKKKICWQNYDYHSADFGKLAERASEPFTKANKKVDEGVGILNTLLKHGALKIHQDAYDLLKLCQELYSLKSNVDKRHAKDDYSDALRYACSSIPWNMERIKIKRKKVEQKPPSEIELRRQRMFDPQKTYATEVDAEIAEWNSLYEPN